MTHSTRLDKALRISARLHEGQYRKDNAKTPYIIHPVAVMNILSDYTSNEDILIAGLLHDVLEDVKLPYKEKEELITKEFGEKVLSIVKEVSEENDPMRIEGQIYSWEERKQRYIDQIKTASEEALYVCAADKIHNLLSLTHDYHLEGPSHWTKYKITPQGKLWLFEEIFKILKERLHSPIVEEYGKFLEEAQELAK